MGRTNPTYRDQVRSIEERWGDYRRALRGQDQPHFDRLFEHGRQYADAAGYQNPTDPMLALLVSIVLAQERRITELETQFDERES
ncbi:hypothetical protein Halru_2820 [Halovivax ruber XH-70]|uniref:DUF8156 domain-containing protein n=1 Tax=Halovivax ruber (strain DSM 18193 / JCM 13892 / XH-70) TaxID=797302 RepID=L0IGQ2_HALRX|nr:hypothetical protein [Halovivax ruber]AGB17391.1 hypothetical protein Halru_2820 [Halovivax ruber XH-70]